MKSETLSIAILQVEPTPNVEKSLAHADEWVNAIKPQVDLIILPETFSTGFVKNGQPLAEDNNGRTHQWLQTTAKRTGAVVAGGLYAKENGSFFNRFVAAFPDGSVITYDKRHLFILSGEQHHLTPGKKNSLLMINGWRIRPVICYDLRFPVWCRNAPEENDSSYDCLCVIGAWPAARMYAWNTLLHARAIENTSYVLGVNRVGTGEIGEHYSGGSVSVDPSGETILLCEDWPCARIITLDRDRLARTRAALPFLKDADSFRLE